MQQQKFFFFTKVSMNPSITDIIYSLIASFSIDHNHNYSMI